MIDIIILTFQFINARVTFSKLEKVTTREINNNSSNNSNNSSISNSNNIRNPNLL
jgi:hypothetical protein